MRNLFFVLSTVVLFFTSCEKDEETVSSIQIDQQSITIKIGEQHQFNVNHSPSNLKAPFYQWVSSNPQVVSITSEGLITGSSVGNSTITVTALNGSLQSTSLVTVVPIQANGINLNKSDLSIFVGETSLLTYTIEPTNTTNKEVEWLSDNISVATVVNGTITAVSPGTTNIKVKIKNTDKESACIVTVKPIEATSITLNKTELSILAGETSNLTYIITPDNTTFKDVEWITENTTVATVSNGTITAVSPGVTKIKVKIKNTNIEAICQVTVNPVLVTGVSLNQTNAQITKGGTIQLNATITPSNATNKSLIWNSSNINIANVVDGLITGISTGDAVITVRTIDGEYTASCQIKVIPVAVNGVSLNKTSLSLITSETFQLVANIAPSNAENKVVSWKSSNENVASVDEFGIVSAKSEGSAQITVETNDGNFTAICNVTIVPITEKITLRLGGSFSSINGWVTGSMYSYISNSSSLPITLTKFEIIDSNSNLVKVSTTDASLLGTLDGGATKNLGGNISSVYKPIFKWYFTFNGVSYTVQHQYQ